MTFAELVTYITEYDSNTFFAKGCSLTKDEAIKLAEKSIDYFVNNDLDGVKLDCWLYELRGDE